MKLSGVEGRSFISGWKLLALFTCLEVLMSRSVSILSSCCVLLFLASSTQAQIPDTFTNLQLLDEEIERSDLVEIMKDWAGGLGVRCAHCHVGPDNLQGMDFASDDKATKRTARRMLEMSRVINGELLVDLPVVKESDRARAQVVSCYTCHRGMSSPPRNIRSELGRAAGEGGADAALSHYEELKSTHADAGRYDLRSSSLLWLAGQFLEGEEFQEARKVTDEVLEAEPLLVSGWLLLARIEMMAGDLSLAEEALGKAQVIAPDDRSVGWIGRKIQEEKARRQAMDEEPEGSSSDS